jgi:hypothetical protein
MTAMTLNMLAIFIGGMAVGVAMPPSSIGATPWPRKPVRKRL